MQMSICRCGTLLLSHTTFILHPACQNPLYWAAEGGHVDIVEMLCKANADVNQRNDVCIVQMILFGVEMMCECVCVCVGYAS